MLRKGVREAANKSRRNAIRIWGTYYLHTSKRKEKGSTAQHSATHLRSTPAAAAPRAGGGGGGSHHVGNIQSSPQLLAQPYVTPLLHSRILELRYIQWTGMDIRSSSTRRRPHVQPDVAAFVCCCLLLVRSTNAGAVDISPALLHVVPSAGWERSCHSLSGRHSAAQVPCLFSCPLPLLSLQV